MVYNYLEELNGCFVIMVVNLVFCKMKFGVLEGMILLVGIGGLDFFLFLGDEGICFGM